MTLDPSLASLLDAAGHSPVIQALAIIIATFILEDAATVLAAMQVQTGVIDMSVALGALYVGIVLGDVGLYGLGRLAALVPWAERLIPRSRRDLGAEWLQTHLVKLVFVSRFLPGARLPTYTACGFLRADLLRFTLTAIVATLIWTTLLFGVSLHVGRLLIDHLGAWRWAGAGGFALTLVLVGRLAARLRETALNETR